MHRTTFTASDCYTSAYTNIMGRIVATVRIPLAVCISIALVIGAYLLARGVGVPSAAQASQETALLQAIAARDSTGDGLPDWEKALYGIPLNATTTDYFHLGMTDSEAVAKGLIVPKAVADVPAATSSPASIAFDSSLPPPPADGTLTAAFSRNFFSAYLAAKRVKGGAAFSQNDVNAIANQVLGSLSQSIVPAPDFKTAKDLAVSGSGPDALKQFAMNAEAVFKRNTATATTSELNYLQSALANNDATALLQLASIAAVYRNTAVGLAMVPVPQELAAADFVLVNSMMRIGEITSDFARVNSDPLATMLALYQYPQAVVYLAAAFSSIGDTYRNAGIALPPGTPGVSFVNIAAKALPQGNPAPKKP